MNKAVQLILADDDRDDRFFFEKAMKSVPVSCNLVTVEDGEQLLDLLNSGITPSPDVIFMDLNMPRSSGSECLMSIKQNDLLTGIPVIIYSTCLHEEVADSLFEKGAHYFLQKCDFAELPAAIHKVLMLLSENGNRPVRKDFIIRSPV